MTRSLYVAAGLLGVVLSRGVVGAPPLIPDDAIGYYRLDPSEFDQQGAVLLPVALNFAQRIGLVDSEFKPIFDGVLAASVAGSVPHTLCLLDLDVVFDEHEKRGFRIEAFSAVLVLETAENHRTFLNTLDTIISSLEVGGAQPSLFDLSDGSRAARLKAVGWEDWRAVEWASVPGAFLVGVGQGTLDHWMRDQQNGDLSGSINLHREAVSGQATAAASFLEVWLNLEQAHVRMPEVLAQGRIRRWLTTWQLDGARSWMFHGRWSDQYLLADVTWQRVGVDREHVYTKSLTRGSWPDDLTLPRPKGSYVVVIPIDLQAAFERILDARRATISDTRLAAFDLEVLRYRAKKERVYDAIWRAFKPYVILSNDPPLPIAVPGATTVFFELKDLKDARVTQARLEALLEQFMETPDVKKLGDSVVRHDRAEDVYWLQLESTGTLRVPTWGWANQYLIGSWGPSVITTHRERLKRRGRR